jgi:hypothetical protein
MPNFLINFPSYLPVSSLILAVISVVDGHKGVPIAADALFLRASDLTHAASTASESDLLSCGLTPDELEDLQVRSTPVSFSETQKSKPAWQ